jgi:flagellin
MTMGAVINTNVLSLNAQRNLGTSQSALATALQRLSSGLRINSAKDDAAGLAISDRFTTQIRGLNQAIRNASDGISLAQTAESTLGELTNNLQRIRELAVQAANSTNSSSDRSALDLEVQQRLAEIERIASQTSFNGQKVLDGTFGSATFQVGANVGETISLNLSNSVRTNAIGKTADYVGAATYSSALAVGQQGASVSANPLASGNLTLALGSGQAVAVGASASYIGGAASQGATSAYAKAAAINAAGVGGLTAVADTTLQVAFATVNASTTANDTYSLSINGQAIYTAATTVLDGTAVATAINTNSSATGVTAAFDSTTNLMTLTAVDGRNITTDQTIGSAGTANEGLNGTGGGTNNTVNAALAYDTLADGAVDTLVAYGSIRLTAASTIVVGGATPGNAGLTTGSLALGATALSAANVTTVANANTAITRVDAALTSVSTLRSTFGAIQNRFESTIASLAAVTENLEASRSRILDADFAAETANLTRAQILQQAGIAILAQANAAPQTVLALLQ